MKKKKLTKEEWNGIIEKVLYKKAAIDDKINIAVSMGITMNIGNYESLKYGISASMDCKAEYADEVRGALEEYIEDKLRDKYASILKGKEDIDIENNINVENNNVDEIELEEI